MTIPNCAQDLNKKAPTHHQLAPAPHVRLLLPAAIRMRLRLLPVAIRLRNANCACFCLRQYACGYGYCLRQYTYATPTAPAIACGNTHAATAIACGNTPTRLRYVLTCVARIRAAFALFRYAQYGLSGAPPAHFPCPKPIDCESSMIRRARRAS